MPGTAGGTQRFRTFTVCSATSSRLACFGHFLPAMTMLGLRMVCSSGTLGVVELLVDFLQHPLGHLLAASMSCAPSISTSGSTIGTSPPSTQIAA